LDNGEYESTGAQKTVSDTVQFCEMAIAAGYPRVSTLNSLKEIRKHLLPQKQRLSFLNVPIQSGTIDNLPRQVITPPQVASRFKKHIQGIE
jgi:phosphonopyruvate decarboxylase